VLQIADALPSAPKVLAELNTLLQDPNNGLDEVSGKLRLDSGLTARVMRIANGAVYNQGDPVASLDEALARVGFNEVYRLAGMASVAQLVNFQLQFYQTSAARLRENALFVALMMEELAPLAQLDTRAAYTAGLLRCIGKIALDATAQRDLRSFRPVAMTAETQIRNWETEVFGLTNSAVAEALLRNWRLPFEVYVPIRDHYLDDLAVDPLPAAELLHLAASAAEAHGLGLSGESRYWAKAPAALRAKFSLGEARFGGISARAFTRFERLKAALG
jgi:HD-like signal output (HDOD) protein